MFETIEELKIRVSPVLKIKAKELKKLGINITADEIFEDLSNNIWSKKKNLHLYEIVNDIINYKNDRCDKDE